MELPGSPRGTQLQWESLGKSTFRFSSDNNNADFAFHADLYQEIVAEVQEAGDPKTLHEARSHRDWPCWKRGMDHELATSGKAGTCTRVSRPLNKNVVGRKWVFRIKRNADGSLGKYKACLVEMGVTQVHGTDYFDTFSPIAKLSSFRTTLALHMLHAVTGRLRSSRTRMFANALLSISLRWGFTCESPRSFI